MNQNTIYFNDSPEQMEVTNLGDCIDFTIDDDSHSVTFYVRLSDVPRLIEYLEMSIERISK